MPSKPLKKPTSNEKKKEPESTAPVVRETTINTDGGNAITGDISVAHDFIMGDKVINNYPPSAPKVDPMVLWERFKEMPIDYLPTAESISAGSYFNMPVSSKFVGRHNELTQLAQFLSQESKSSVVAIAATGLGGIGKTQLVAEFCRRYGQYFGGGVYWLNFESAETARTDLARIAPLLNEAWLNIDIDSQINMILNHPDGWTADIPRLLVFDNLEDPKLLNRYKPSRGGSRILLTSRWGSWSHVGVDGLETLTLGILSRAESVALLQKLAPQLSDSQADEIAHELGDLPLALHVAGTYLSHFAETTMADAYLDDLKALSITQQLGQQATDIEEEGAINPTNHTWHIGRTFRLSYDQLLDKDIVAGAENRDSIKWIARRLLARTAVYAPGTAIPTELLFETFEITELVEDAEVKEATKDTRSLTYTEKSGSSANLVQMYFW